MIDQLIIGDKASFDDFGASLATRKIGQPPKKSIKDTVPFSNKTYDFSRINGELYWEERELEYVFEILADTPEQLEERKQAFVNWLMQVHEEQIHDPHIPDFHFVGTYDDMDTDDDDGLEKTTITVKFTAYPYKVANLPKKYIVELPASTNQDVTVINDSAHRLVPTLVTDADIILKIDYTSLSVSAGEYIDDTLTLEPGSTTMTVQNISETDCTVTITFYEEVL